MGDWRGGVNEDEQPSALQPNELRIARNVYLKGTALSARNGFTRLQTVAINSGASGGGVWQLARAQGATLDFIGVFGNQFLSDIKNATPTDRTGAITVTAGQNNLVTFTNFNEVAIMCNGVDAPWQWTGSGNASVLGGSPPLFNTMLAKWNRVFGAGHAAAPRTIRYTPAGDAATWTSSLTVAAILGDSSSAIEGRDFIWQLGHLGDSIFVGLQNSLGRVIYTGDSTTPFRYTQLADFGIEGAHVYVAYGPIGYFLSRRGVHRISPDETGLTYESSLISGRKLRNTWDELNKARIRYSYGTLYRTVDGNTLILWPLTTGGGTIHNITLVMDVTEGPGKESFWWWTGWDANAMASVINASTRAEELLKTTTTGFVDLCDDDTDDNTAAYTAEAATRWEDFGLPAQKKNFRDLYLELKQTGIFNLNIDAYYDYATTVSQRLTQTTSGAAQASWNGSPVAAVWNTALWPTLGIIRSYLLGVDDGVTLSLRFYTSGANQPWSVYRAVPSVEAIGESQE